MAFRRGQWVKTTRDLKLQVPVPMGQPLELTVPAPSVGIHNKPIAGREYFREGQAKISASQKQIDEGIFAGFCEVALVDEGGFTAIEALIPVDAIVAITKRDEIPAARIRTYDPKWQPEA